MKARCWKTHWVAAPCAKCGKYPAELHIPDSVFQADGENPQYYCADCCPICRAVTALERYPD